MNLRQALKIRKMSKSQMNSFFLNLEPYLNGCTPSFIKAFYVIKKHIK